MLLAAPFSNLSYSHIVPVVGVGEGVAVGNIKMVVVNVMQEHIDTAEVVGGEVDLLPIKTDAHIFFAENLGKFKQ